MTSRDDLAADTLADRDRLWRGIVFGLILAAPFWLLVWLAIR